MGINSDLDAIMTIENAEASEDMEEVIDAWQFLINSGTVWKLQGFYGRTATKLIEAGICKAKESA